MDAGSVMPLLIGQAANLLFAVNQVFPMGHSQLEILSGIKPETLNLCLHLFTIVTIEDFSMIFGEGR